FAQHAWSPSTDLDDHAQQFLQFLLHLMCLARCGMKRETRYIHSSTPFRATHCCSIDACVKIEGQNACQRRLSPCVCALRRSTSSSWTRKGLHFIPHPLILRKQRFPLSHFRKSTSSDHRKCVHYLPIYPLRSMRHTYTKEAVRMQRVSKEARASQSW